MEPDQLAGVRHGPRNTRRIIRRCWREQPTEAMIMNGPEEGRSRPAVKSTAICMRVTLGGGMCPAGSYHSDIYIGLVMLCCRASTRSITKMTQNTRQSIDRSCIKNDKASSSQCLHKCLLEEILSCSD